MWGMGRRIGRIRAGYRDRNAKDRLGTDHHIHQLLYLSLPPLEPNWGQGIGALDHTRHKLFLELIPNEGACVDADQILDNIWEALKGFRFFNDGANTIATFNFYSHDKNIGYFNTLGWMGLKTDWLTWNPSKVPVRFTFNDASRIVTAQTLDDHMLVGIRKWGGTTPSCLGRLLRTALFYRLDGSI